VSGVGVEFLDDGYVAALMPDVVAAYRRKPEPRTLRSDSIVIAVEVVSPSSKANDRHLKPSLYAGAGIPHYWRIEIDSFVGQRTDALPIVFAYVLKDGDYVLEQRVGAGNLLQISDPFEISFDPAILADY
jgi:Uma2 family endonuclease